MFTKHEYQFLGSLITIIFIAFSLLSMFEYSGSGGLINLNERENIMRVSSNSSVAQFTIFTAQLSLFDGLNTQALLPNFAF